MIFSSASLRLCGFLLFAIHCSLFTASAQTPDYAKWVNPFIGTGGHGHTFPGATMPFGMVQLSPDTRIDNWDGSSGYHYSDDIIYGFSHTHLSGTGIPDGCDILFMPSMGERGLFRTPWGGQGPEWYVSKFSHQNERSEPGYYSVLLDKHKILAELTATQRVGLQRHTFPTDGKGLFVLDLKWRDKHLDSTISISGDRRIEGFRRSQSWAKDQTVYFVAEFSKPFKNSYGQTGVRDVIHVPGTSESNLVRQYDTKDYQRSFEFDVKSGEQIMLKVAISYVSIEGARKNLEAELPHWDFDKVRADAKAAWNKELSKIEVSGGTPEQTTNFYTALYHTMVQPNVFNDVDGQYRGHDGKVHRLPGYSAAPVAERRSSASPGGPENISRGYAAGFAEGRQSRRNKNEGLRKSTAFPLGDGQSPNPKSKIQNPRSGDHYTVFSLWDTFRAAHPLYTIIDQKRTVDFINTFIRQYEQGGRLPVWELWGEETDTMIGYHAVSVIADAMQKGIKGFDYEKAYAAAKHSAELDHFGLAGYKRRGYISMEDENESVSRTLEYAYNDWCIAQMAKILERDWTATVSVANRGDSGASGQAGRLRSSQAIAQYQTDHQKFSHRARYFENLFDTKTGFFRAKKNGGFVEPFSPTEVNFGFTEGNSWQYSFFVPHDVTRLMQLMGGRANFVAKLDELFTTTDKLSGREQADLTGLIGQYAHGNEPSHHIVYLYNYAGQPWKTQKYVRQIMDNFYKNAPDGLIGNEDCGQMSAWYILSASGFYPVNPGDGVYALGTPLFPEVKYRLENGKTFTVRAKGLSDKSFYVGQVAMNGRHHYQSFLTHDQIINGGTLEFTMSQTPGKGLTIGPKSTNPIETVAVPVITAERSFVGSTRAELITATRNAQIHYTVDGTEPTPRSTVYRSPIYIRDSSTIKAIAVGATGITSFPVEAKLTKRLRDWTAKIVSGYSTQYTGGGDSGIIDGVRGTTNFASGEWQGVQGRPFEAIIDLKRPTKITEVGASFLQVAGPWIWMPDRVEFEVSGDGVQFRKVTEIRPEFPQREMTPTIREYISTIAPPQAPITARYVRIKAFNFGKIPSWHLGAGGDPWIFIDEVIIR